MKTEAKYARHNGNMQKSSSSQGRISLQLTCLLLMVVLVTAEGGTSDQPPDDSTQDPSISSTDFAIQLHKALVASDPNGNVIFSPFSITAVLAVLLEGAREKTAEQLIQALHWEHSFVEVRHSFQRYLGLLKEGGDNYTLTTANRMFADEEFSILDEFVSSTVPYYGSNIISADFEENFEKERQAINQWVLEETKGKIRDLFPPGSITPYTVMVIANAIYFKGSWANPFRPELTKPGTFTTDTGDKFTVDLMRIQKKLLLGYHEDLNSFVVELPYLGEDLSMFLVVPNKDKQQTLASLEAALTEEAVLEMTRSVSLSLVNLVVPKFKVRSLVDAKAILSSLGVKDLFLSSAADLSGIDGKKDLYVSKMLHEAYLEVNEEGTEAAAATAARIQKRSVEFPVEVHADHPFLFFVWDDRADVVLFLGRFAKPDDLSLSHESTTPRVEL